MLTSIRIENFRCLRNACVDLDETATGIIGSNGSGKTSFLEAIYFLAHGRSFRTALRTKLVGPEHAFFRITGNLNTPGKGVYGGVEFASGKLRVRMGGEELPGIAALTRALPVQIVDPSIHRLVEEGSAPRRRLLDWGVFHVEPAFVAVWRRYQRALNQRNAALRDDMGPQAVSVWVPELNAMAEQMDSFRAGYMSRLAPLFGALTARLLGFEVRARYSRGWSEGVTLAAELDACATRDRRLKTTTTGAHRADVIFQIDGQVARERVSRGQQKMLALAFVLAQLQLRVQSQSAPRSCLLLDDPAAELDVDNLGKVLAVLSELPVQLVVTSLTSAGLESIRFGKMFHVKQGDFTAML